MERGRRGKREGRRKNMVPTTKMEKTAAILWHVFFLVENLALPPGRVPAGQT